MTPDPDLVSVIIPHLNQEDHLRRCLSSLQSQSGISRLVEIIVVDNGSNKLPSELCGSFDGVKLEKEKTPGPGPARNKGIAVSTGAILTFIDADCIADPGWIAAIMSVLDKDSTHQVLGGDVRIAIADPARLTMLEAYESIFAYRQQEYIERMGFSGTGNLAMRRESFDKVGPFAGIQIAEDRDWGRRAISAGFSIIYVPKMIVFHPARQNIDELFEKWNRHIDHDYAEYAQQRFGRIRWTFYALAVALSPIFELRRILMSSRLSTFRDKCLAAVGLIRVRFYRAWRMLLRLYSSDLSSGNSTWNRS